MKNIIFGLFVGGLLAIFHQQPSKVDGTPLTIPVCSPTTEKLHWDGDSYECVSDSGGGGGESIPSGSILVIESGSCPNGYTETLNGQFLLGTNNASGDVGTTGGSNSITPNGSISSLVFSGSSVLSNSVSAGTPTGTISQPTFTGNALANHAHELPLQLVSGTSTRHLSATTFGTGTSRAAQGADTATANTTSAAVALSQAVSAGTPAGTVSIPTFTGTALGTHQHTVTATGSISGGDFTGTQFDNRPSYTKVIFCKKS